MQPEGSSVGFGSSHSRQFAFNGIAWICLDTFLRAELENGEEIAVKVLYNNMPEIDDVKFQHEFENLMRLEHHNIVSIWEEHFLLKGHTEHSALSICKMEALKNTFLMKVMDLTGIHVTKLSRGYGRV
uniref:Protein kinase domain-containing protein n=1 Tax=Triticum aestivum TaxID=4565 RepID=A0A080YU95_WHEAT|nr:unnamed protein product [Triticum aestivum]